MSISRANVDLLVVLMQAEPWKLFWDHLHLKYAHFAEFGLAPRALDSLVWETCQNEELVLITDNRNKKGFDSLEATIQTRNTPTSLPVFTIANVPHLRTSTRLRRSRHRQTARFIASNRYVARHRAVVPALNQWTVRVAEIRASVRVPILSSRVPVFSSSTGLNHRTSPRFWRLFTVNTNGLRPQLAGRVRRMGQPEADGDWQNPQAKFASIGEFGGIRSGCAKGEPARVFRGAQRNEHLFGLRSLSSSTGRRDRRPRGH
jgi:hypothetical protein